jgi:peroxiredoxin (alkyl hydroperoxide reductase subunit C)
MPEKPAGCATPSKGPIAQKQPEVNPTQKETQKEVFMELARVGKPAPDFELTAFQGEGFRPIKLSDLKGKWIVICFYPGDFTFV